MRALKLIFILLFISLQFSCKEKTEFAGDPASTVMSGKEADAIVAPSPETQVVPSSPAPEVAKELIKFTALRTEPSELNLDIGTSADIKVWGKRSDGTEVEITKESKAKKASEIVNLDKFPRIKGIEPGKGEIVVKAVELEIKLPVVVNPSKPEKLTISPESSELIVGLAKTYQSFLHYPDGRVVEATMESSWALSGDIKGFSLKDNVVTAIAKASEVKLTASWKELKASIAIKSIQDPKVEYYLDPAKILVHKGENFDMRAMVIAADGDRTDMTCSVNWDFEPKGKVQVVLDGEKCLSFKALAVGSVKVKASKEKHIAQGEIEIREAKLVALKADPEAIEIPSGMQQIVKIIGSFSDNSEKEVKADLISLDPNIAQVNIAEKLVVTGIKSGETKLEAKVSDFKIEIPAVVTPPLLKNVLIEPKELIVPAGLSQEIKVIAEFSDGSKKDVSGMAEVRSLDPTIGSAEKTKITALKKGETEIEVVFNGKKDLGKLKVVDALVMSVAITPEDKTLQLNLDDKIGVQYALRAKFSDGSSLDVTKDAKWVSSDIAIAEISNLIDNAGFVVDRAIGVAKISASFMNKSDETNLSITPPPDPEVGLVLNGSMDDQTIARHFSLELVWSSKNASSCSLLFKGASEQVLGSDLNGNLAMLAENEGQFEISCSNIIGKKADANIALSLTDPSASLLLNSEAADITIGESESFIFSWSAKNVESCSLKQSGSVISTDLADSLELSVVEETDFNLSCEDSAGTKVILMRKVKVYKDNFSISFNGSYNKIEPGTEYKRPVAIYFALDVTGSMSGEIAAVKNSVISITDKLTELKYDVAWGAVTFDDGIRGKFNLNSNSVAFKNFITGQSASGGGDGPEAGLLAIETALSEIRSRETRDNAVKVIVVVTDNKAHHGESPRSFKLAQTKNAFNNTDAGEHPAIKFFYANPSYYSSQFENILNGIFPSVNKDQRGGSLSWPISATFLTDKLPAYIKAVTPDLNLICLAKSASLSGPELFLEKSFDLAAINNDAKAAKNSSFSFTANADQSAAILSGSASLSVTHCCISEKSAAKGDFGNCLEEEDKVIPFSY